ncbi:nucleotide-binding protein [Aeromicrobium sp.]|uniref:nucleotide-binding protein n=1 Tax=Aeromicrobium sp. TaxID=1871063 RepID=UPI0030BFA81D
MFVVHGRNEPLRKAIFDLLRSLDLKPIEWNHAVELTGTGTPYIGQVLDAAFEHAQAVVVLMTPDEVAYLQPRYGSGDHDPETQPSAQARPNVLFEAGMALGRNPTRTVLVEVGTVRPFSDIAGRHTVRLTNDPASRQTLAGRLKTAGCPVDLSGTDWQTTGDFTSPGAPGDGLPLGRRVPSNTQPRPAVAFDAHYRSSGKSGGRLQVINRGTEAAYDVAVAIPDEASLAVIEEGTIEKIPGGGKSVTLRTIDRLGNTLGGPRGKRAFDLTITARTESGDRITEDVFLDMNG